MSPMRLGWAPVFSYCSKGTVIQSAIASNLFCLPGKANPNRGTLVQVEFAELLRPPHQASSFLPPMSRKLPTPLDPGSDLCTRFKKGNGWIILSESFKRSFPHNICIHSNATCLPSTIYSSITYRKLRHEGQNLIFIFYNQIIY